ncbi:MAG: FeoA family protein [Dehalococcoidia bacterium]
MDTLRTPLPASIVDSPGRRAAASAPRLTSLRPGQTATVRALDNALQGAGRSRLLDLGLTPGTTVAAERSSMFRDPVAYRIRGALVALRRQQADLVLIFA